MKEKTTKKKKKRIGLKIFLTILVILAIVAVAFAYKVHKNGGGLSGTLKTVLGHDEQTLKNLPEVHFLVLGVSGEDDYKLADTIMVGSYDPKSQQAALLSIPRDTYVGANKNKASASYKINSTYRNGENIEGMKEYVEEIVGFKIPYYFVIDTDGLVQLVDAIGGVNFNVPINMTYDDYSQDLHIRLNKGEQLINGEKAEWLLRFRHNNNGTTYPYEYGQEDLGRMRTQREFITATLKQTLKAENILKINKIIDIMYQNIKTNVELGEIKDYVPYAVDFDVNNLKTGMLPGESEKCNGIWIYTYNKKESKELVNELFVEAKTQKESNGITVEILNGTDSQANLDEVKAKLTQEGYTVNKTGTTSSTSKTTIINRTNQTGKTESELKEILTIGSILVGENNAKVDFTIIIGKDY